MIKNIFFAAVPISLLLCGGCRKDESVFSSDDPTTVESRRVVRQERQQTIPSEQDIKETLLTSAHAARSAEELLDLWSELERQGTGVGEFRSMIDAAVSASVRSGGGEEVLKVILGKQGPGAIRDGYINTFFSELPSLGEVNALLPLLESRSEREIATLALQDVVRKSRPESILSLDSTISGLDEASFSRSLGAGVGLAIQSANRSGSEVEIWNDVIKNYKSDSEFIGALVAYADAETVKSIWRVYPNAASEWQVEVRRSLISRSVAYDPKLTLKNLTSGDSISLDDLSILGSEWLRQDGIEASSAFGEFREVGQAEIHDALALEVVKYALANSELDAASQWAESLLSEVTRDEAKKLLKASSEEAR